MVARFEESKSEMIGNDYLVMGVAERRDWLESKKGKMSQSQTIERILVFKDVLDFELVQAGWYHEDEIKSLRQRHKR